MEKDQHQDEFIRKIVRQQGLEKAPEGFAGKVMGKIQPAGEKAHEPLFSTGVWIAIFLGAAALVTTMFLIDMPFIDKLFSSSDIQRIYMNVFNYNIFESFVNFFKELRINGTVIIIILAAVSLVIIERIVARRRSAQRLAIF